MKDSPPIDARCKTCGALIEEEIIGGLCPVCVGLTLFGFESEVDPTELESEIQSDPILAREDQEDFTIDRYTLLEKIGEGGFGSVYRAIQTMPIKREVAIKVIKRGMDTDQVVKRFEAERHALAIMDHPNIATVYDADATKNGRPYFVMELVSGESITDYCNRLRLSTEQRLKLFIEVCGGIQHAHQKGVIHRDIKPSNVLMTMNGERPKPKVIDFGVAKAMQTNLTDNTVYTHVQQIIGTPAYMSPEQADVSGVDVDTRSDVYSLGVLLYELLTDRTPFETKNVSHEEIRRKIREDDPKKPSTQLSTLGAEALSVIASRRQTDATKIRRMIQGDLDWIVLKALEKNRERRYETADGLAQDIEHHLANDPVLAVAPSSFYLLRKFATRHKGPLVAGLAIFGILTAAVAVSSWWAFEATEAWKLADLKADNEATARRAEAEQRVRAEQALFNIRYQNADASIRSDDTATGLASLARLLRDFPDNQLVAHRLVSMLRRKSFPLPAKRSLLTQGTRVARLSPDGSIMLTVSEQGVIELFDTDNGYSRILPIETNDSPQKAVFSPDGRYFAIAFSSFSIRVWDVASGASLTGPLVFNEHILHFEFNHEGDRIVAASTNGKVKIWNSRTGAPVSETLVHEGWAQWAEFSPDGKKLVTVSRGPDWSKVRIWNVETGELFRGPLAYEDPVVSARYSPNGERIITTSVSGPIRFLDAQTGLEAMVPFQSLRNYGHYGIEFSPSGAHFLTVSIGAKAGQVWDASNGGPVTTPLQHTDRVYLGRFNYDGTQVITGSHDKTARVWDAETGQAIIEPIRHQDKLSWVEFSPDGETALTSSNDQRALLWDIRSGQEQGLALKHQNGLYTCRFNSTGTRALTASSDGTAGLWDVESGRRVLPFFRHQSRSDFNERSYVFSAEFSPDETMIVTGSTGNAAAIWNAQNGELLWLLEDHQSSVRFACFSPDSQIVATACQDGYARLWDAHTGQMLFEPIHAGKTELGLLNWIVSIDFNPEGDRFVTAANAGYARVWNTRTGKPLTPPLVHDQAVHKAVFDPRGEVILTASADGSARRWKAQTGESIGLPFLHDGLVNDVQFSPDGTKILTASTDHTARIWSTATGKPLSVPMRHDGAVNSARFNQKGNRIVTASDDHTARIWEAKTGFALSEPFVHEDEVLEAEFNHTGSRVLTASKDHTARVWITPTLPSAVPTWLPTWAETVACLQFDPLGIATHVPVEALIQFREKIMASPEKDTYTQFAKWFFQDRASRPDHLEVP
ncbi:protein kinase [bacterium]|nr:protein kinase [bacterium]